MKTKTRDEIIDLAHRKGRIRPAELVDELGISQVAVHKQLNKLVEEGSLFKTGKPPLVFYVPSHEVIPVSTVLLDEKTTRFIEENYLYITPSGVQLPGVKGFNTWVRQIKQTPFFKELALEYVKTRREALRLFTKKGWLDATFKIKESFPDDAHLDNLVYQDFYALPKFGKTKLGQLVLHAKQAQNKHLIAKLAQEISPTIRKLIEHHKIEAIGFIPHSIPRKTPFLKELRRALKIDIPEVSLVKAYTGEIPIAQKSLSKLEERIENAQTTIFINETSIKHHRILLIDDAVGSGATLNESAKKLKQEYQVAEVYGFAIVGSYKGFEVIREI